MAWNAVCRVSALNKRRPAAFSSLSSGLTAEHDRQNRRFTVRPDSGAGEWREPRRALRCRERSCTRGRRPPTACWTVDRCSWLLYTKNFFILRSDSAQIISASFAFGRRKPAANLCLNIYQLNVLPPCATLRGQYLFILLRTTWF